MKFVYISLFLYDPFLLEKNKIIKIILNRIHILL